MGVNPTSIAELHFPEVIIDIALFSSRTSSFFKYWGRPLIKKDRCCIINNRSHARYVEQC